MALGHMSWESRRERLWAQNWRKPGKFDVTKAKEKSFRKEAAVKHRMSLRAEGGEDSDRLLGLMVQSCVAWLRPISAE